jgi:hypothetical protein
MVIAAATAGVLAVSAPAFARQDRPNGAITGTVDSVGSMRVIATAANGQTFRSRVRSNGHFRIKHLPAGTYTLTFAPSCGERWTVEYVVVGTEETVVPNVRNEGECIVVGLLRIEDEGAATAGASARERGS